MQRRKFTITIEDNSDDNEQASGGGLNRLNMGNHQGSFKIYVRNSKNERFALDVKASNTVKDIKAKISHLKGIDIAEQRLIYIRHTLNDDLRTLRDCEIVAGSTLDLIQKPVMRIIIKTLLGDTWPLIVGEHATTKDVITMMEKLHGVRANPRLCFKGKRLSDDDKLSAYGVGPDSELHLVFRLRAGNSSPKCC